MFCPLPPRMVCRQPEDAIWSSSEGPFFSNPFLAVQGTFKIYFVFVIVIDL